MCENNELEMNAIPKAECENRDENLDTTPKTQTVIPIKFNKEVRNLSIDEASLLAQKGLKFDAIQKEYELLRQMANEKDMSVSVYLKSLQDEEENRRLNALTEKCGGDSALAAHILELEKGKKTDKADFDEIKEFFPDIKSVDMLPPQVLENAALSGRNLLDEYLRYSLKEKLKVKEAEKNYKSALKASSGSQINRSGQIAPETAEFLKGLWN